MNDILRKSEVNQEDRIRHSQTASLRARKNEPITSDGSRCLFHVQFKRSCQLAVISHFFVAKKPSPMTPTCTVVNFHNLHSLLDLFGREREIQSIRRSKGNIEDFLQKKNGQLVVSNQVVTDPCCGLAVIFCGFISRLIGRETINIPEIFFSVHGFMGKTVKKL